ncbi:hypothetical protein [Novosphingobium guangzhouense]|uniref:Uncharacterized protein n=1 Tax=Novosphingobium guangzhouense TaxID=1850347 RepID=A0A2K2G006_9SPHN|nr:hypothetical protein [Novosphingobium guangzhouense]PNU04363.1 hypothetical protein A8V01_20455 [Novosphingobium guangzhouense]
MLIATVAIPRMLNRTVQGENDPNAMKASCHNAVTGSTVAPQNSSTGGQFEEWQARVRTRSFAASLL